MGDSDVSRAVACSVSLLFCLKCRQDIWDKFSATVEATLERLLPFRCRPEPLVFVLLSLRKRLLGPIYLPGCVFKMQRRIAISLSAVRQNGSEQPLLLGLRRQSSKNHQTRAPCISEIGAIRLYQIRHPLPRAQFIQLQRPCALQSQEASLPRYLSRTARTLSLEHWP